MPPPLIVNIGSCLSGDFTHIIDNMFNFERRLNSDQCCILAAVNTQGGRHADTLTTKQCRHWSNESSSGLAGDITPRDLVINSVNWLYNRVLLENAGVDLKTVTYLELPFPNMVDAVVNGQVDAAAIVQPFLFFGASSGKVRIVGYDLLDVQPGVQVSGFAVSRKWAMANPRTLAAFERAVARAVDYLMANEAQAKQIIVKFTKAKPEIIEGSGLPSWTNEITVSNVEKQMDLMVKHGLLPKRQDVNELIWTSARSKQ